MAGVALLIALALSLSETFAVLPPFPPEGSHSFGINIHYQGHPPLGALPMLRETGVQWIRMDFGWNVIESEKGQYNFTLYDQLSSDLADNNLSAIYILDYGNPLYDGGLAPYTAEGRAAFASFAVAAVEHFAHGPINILWEMWNEPNIGFWKPTPNVTQYIELAKAVGTAIKSANVTATYIGPATSGMDWNFLETCFQAGLLDYWDAVTVHPYRNDPPEDASADFSTLHAMIRKYTSRSVLVISSEWGYSARYPHYDVTRQSKVLPRMWLNNMANNISLSIWYDWVNDGANQTYTEHHFGTVYNTYHPGLTPVFDPKPTYFAAQTFNKILVGCTVNQVYSTGKDYIHALQFSCLSGSEMPVVVWCSDDSLIPCLLHLQAANVMVCYDQVNYIGQGLPYLCTDKSGLLTVDVDNAPLYLVPHQ
jgi:hypothetical protein